jgi:hypothetical protein
MEFIEELKWRGLVKDVTDYEGLSRGFEDTLRPFTAALIQRLILCM